MGSYGGSGRVLQFRVLLPVRPACWNILLVSREIWGFPKIMGKGLWGIYTVDLIGFRASKKRKRWVPCWRAPGIRIIVCCDLYSDYHLQAEHSVSGLAERGNAEDKLEKDARACFCTSKMRGMDKKTETTIRVRGTGI